MHITILTLFPEYFETPLATSMLKRAREKGLVTYQVVNIRDFTTDIHRTTDDRPYGGGAGMVMKIEPIARALEFVHTQNIVASAHEQFSSSKQLTLLTSAQGQVFTQECARRYAEFDHLTIICGHYEGVDERVAEHLVDEEVRIGDYVLTGGEPAAAVMIDAIVRLLPGVLGNDESTTGESHDTPGKLGYPQYTRPEVFNEWEVPKVLLGGDHKKIQTWREEQRIDKNGC